MEDKSWYRSVRQVNFTFFQALKLHLVLLATICSFLGCCISLCSGLLLGVGRRGGLVCLRLVVSGECVIILFDIGFSVTLDI